MMEEDNLDDFMEAVTTYKCKFCAFTSTTTQEMGQHVRGVHIVKRVQPAVSGECYVTCISVIIKSS